MTREAQSKTREALGKLAPSAREQVERQEQAARERQREQCAQMDLDYHQRSIQTDLYRDVGPGGPSLGG